MPRRLGLAPLRVGTRALVTVGAGVVTMGLVSAVPASAAAARPVISNLSVRSGPLGGGTRVTVTGKNFAHVTKVEFGTATGSGLRVLSATRLQVTAPRHGAAVVNVAVVAAAGTSAAVPADRFTYVSPPSVARLSPGAGSLAGGTRVTVTGKNFSHVTKVIFGTVAGSGLRVLSATGLQVLAPRHAAGPVDLRVITAYGTSPAVAADRYRYVAPPAVSSVSPATGASKGGTAVRITGTGFTGATEVKFGGAAAPAFSVTSATSITATAPAGTGTVDVRVVTPYGTSAAGGGDRFSYQAAPPSSLTWGAVTRIDGDGYGNLDAVSCPTATDCVAVDDSGHVMTWNGSTWSAPAAIAAADPVFNPSALSCASASWCMAAGGGDSWVYSGGTWTQAPTGNGDQSVSCPTPAFCAAVDGGGDASEWNGSTWSDPVQIDTSQPINGGMSVSCVSASFCEAVDGNGEIFTWSGASWKDTINIGSGNGGWTISCTSATFCLAVTISGATFTFDGLTWTGPGSDGIGTGQAVSCASATFCMAVDAHGDVASYNGGTWTAGTQPVFTADDRAWAAAVSCTAATCAAVAPRSGQADTYVSGTWTGAVIPDASGGISSVSCPTSGFCAAVDIDGGELTDSAGTWSTPAQLSASGDLYSVSCPSATFCLAVDLATGMWKYDGMSWASVPGPTAEPQNSPAVSCVSPTFCVWVGDNDGGISVYNGSTWSAPVLTLDPWSSVSCASQTFCVAGDEDGNIVTFDGRAWSAVTSIGSNMIESISCPTASFCAAIDDVGMAYTFAGSTWTATVVTGDGSLGSGQRLVALSCTSGTFCAALDSGGNAVTFDGTRWSSPGTTAITSQEGLIEATALSCATPTFCVAAGRLGEMAIGT